MLKKEGGDNAARNQANARQQQIEIKEQIEVLGINQKELAEKLKNASPEERQEIMREVRRRAGARRAANRAGK